MGQLVVVAGEASGDRAAAAVVRSLANVQAFGMGGAALSMAGVELVRRMEEHNAMGAVEPLRHALSVQRSFAAVLRAVKKRRPEAALLSGYSEFNAALAPKLKRDGVRVLWYAAPQVWAWRAGRVRTIRHSVDQLALVLPFEEAIWRRAGVSASYVGHPALEQTALPRVAVREMLALAPRAPCVALLPGSRPHEVRSLLGPMLVAFEKVRRDRASLDACVLLASSLDEGTRRWAEAAAREFRVNTWNVPPLDGAAAVLGAFDAALCASGTACLEAAIAGVPPVVLYRVNVATEVVARLLVRTPHIGLPNIILGRRAFEELVQRDVTPARIAVALARVLMRSHPLREACDEVRAALAVSAMPSVRVADMLRPWVS